MTQRDTIKFYLSDGGWVCGTRFLSGMIPEYRSRLNELRKQGMEIEARPCQAHQHQNKLLQEWRWKKPAEIRPRCSEEKVANTNQQVLV